MSGLEIDGVVAVDCETTGLDPYSGARPFLWQTCDSSGKVELYRVEDKRAMKRLKDLLAEESVPKVAHNAKFDWKMARASGVLIRGVVHDTMLMATLINENEKSHGLEYLSQKYLGADNKWDSALASWFQKNAYQLRKRFGDNWKRYDAVPWEIMRHYAADDVVRTIKLAFLFSGPIEAHYRGIYEQELRFLPQLIRIEERGHRVDAKYFRRLRMRAPRRLRSIQRRMHEIAGLPFNPNAPAQVAEAFRALGISSPEKTPKGNDSWAKEVLAGMDHPLARAMLEYRTLSKLSSTYYGPLADRGEADEIIHPQFWQVGSKKGASVRTGRLSSSDPNFQNIPRKDDSVRRGFIPRKGFRIYYFDYKQIEMVIFAHCSRDQGLMQAVCDGKDLHSATAEVLFTGFGGASSEVQRELRQAAKTINFGIVYGMGAKRLAQSLRELVVDMSDEGRKAAGMPLGSITTDGVKPILRRYHSRLPSVGAFSRQCMWAVSKLGYVEDVYGRRYHVPEDLRYKAVNAVVQGCASNVMKQGIIRVGEKVLVEGRVKSGIVNDVHDEIAVEVHRSELSLVPKIKAALEDCHDFDVPIKVDVSVTKTNWADKKPVA